MEVIFVVLKIFATATTRRILKKGGNVMQKGGGTYITVVTVSTRTNLELTPTTLPVFFGNFKYIDI